MIPEEHWTERYASEQSCLILNRLTQLSDEFTHTTAIMAAIQLLGDKLYISIGRNPAPSHWYRRLSERTHSALASYAEQLCATFEQEAWRHVSREIPEGKDEEIAKDYYRLIVETVNIELMAAHAAYSRIARQEKTRKTVRALAYGAGAVGGALTLFVFLNAGRKIPGIHDVEKVQEADGTEVNE